MTRYSSGGTTIVQGGSGPNPTDDFSLGIRMADTNALPADAMSVAFTFPDSNATLADLVKLGLTYADTNPVLADVLLKLGLGLADTNSTPTDALSLGISFADANAALSDLVAIAFTFADTNPALSDVLLQLAITWIDTNPALSDAATHVLNLAAADTSAAPTDTAALNIKGLGDTNTAPTDARTSLAKLWGSGSTGTSNVTNPANADGVNNATNATMQTAAAGATTATLTSNCGSVIVTGTPMPASVVFRGWYKLNTTLATSTAKVVVHSSTAAFTDITIETLAAAATTNDHLTTPFVSGELVGTINTLAKLQSAQIVYSTTDAAAGVSPAVVTVDASSLELTGSI